MFDENEIPFDASDWYWNIGGKVYGSKLNAYIAEQSPEFTAWLNSGRIPENARNEEDVIEVLLRNDIVPPFCTDERMTQWALAHASPVMRHLYKKMMESR